MEIFSKRVFGKVYRWAFLSLMGPPMGWFIILIIADILPINVLLEVVVNPFFWGYLLFFIVVNHLLHWKLDKTIVDWKNLQRFESINRLSKKIPTFYLLLVWVYGLLGPPVVLIRVDLTQLEYFTSWLLGPIVICVFAVPFFNLYLSSLYRSIKVIPLDSNHIYSLSRRFTISFLYLVIGAILMLCVVFSFHQLQSSDNPDYRLIQQIAVLGVITIIMVVTPFMLISRKLKLRLEEVAKLLFQLQKGALGLSMEVEERDHLGLVVHNATQLSSKLELFAGDLTVSADKLKTLESNISHVAEKLRTSGNQQRVNSQSVKADMDEVLVQNRAASENSESLNKEADAILKRITEGSVDMRRLNDTLQQIDQKLQSIDSLSNQTNLLAINASIEASNHSDGKGFAVIASEVRKLSDNSKEISSTIKGSITEIVGKAQSSLDFYLKIEEVTKQNNSRSKEISSATRQQLDLLQALGQSIDQLNLDIQTLAGFDEQMEGFGNELSTVADTIGKTVDFFKPGK